MRWGTWSLASCAGLLPGCLDSWKASGWREAFPLRLDSTTGAPLRSGNDDLHRLPGAQLHVQEQGASLL